MKTKPKNKKKKSGCNFMGLEQFFGSKTRFWLLKNFCANPEKEFFVRELARLANNQLNAIRREISNLVGIGIIKEGEGRDQKKRFYKLNTNFILYNEITALLSKSDLLAEKRLMDVIGKLGDIDLCIITGNLVGEKDGACDLLIVGRINRNTLSAAIGEFEREIDRAVAYAVFSPEEYRQRKALTDKFIFNIFEGKKVVVIDKHGEFSTSEKYETQI